MIGHRKLDSNEVQEELIQKLQSLFTRENLEKDAYFIARMNDRMEIPLQVVYQQKEIYKICPNGRYVLHALNKCSNVLVSQEHLFVVPKILPRRNRIYFRISEIRMNCNLFLIIQNIKDNSKIAIESIQNISQTSAFLTLENEERAIQLNSWISENKIGGEPIEVQVREENLFKTFRNNVKSELDTYYEKLKDDKKSAEMYENLEFFQHSNPVPIQNPTRVGENVFANPYNYFFFQQPGQEQQSKPYVRKSHSGENDGKNNNNNKNTNNTNNYGNSNFFHPMAFLMMQQQYLQGNSNFNAENNQKNHNNLVTKNESAGNQRNHRGQQGNGNSNGQDGEKKRSKNQNKRGRNSSNPRANEGHQQKDANKDNTNAQKKKTHKKNLVDNEENFPSLGQDATNKKEKPAVEAKPISADKPQKPEAQENRAGRKLSTEKRDIEKQPERNVSESKDKQLERKREASTHGTHANKHEETVYFRKGKEIKVRYEKDELVKIFQGIQKSIVPPESIIESSKDDFIPVVNVKAEIEIEVTKPTEVTEQSHSNPGTPYQGTASVPYRKPSITRSNIKRKEQEMIQEVEEKKPQAKQ